MYARKDGIVQVFRRSKSEWNGAGQADSDTEWFKGDLPFIFKWKAQAVLEKEVARVQQQMQQQVQQQMQQQMQQVHEEQQMQMPAQPPLHSAPRHPASAYASHVASPYGNPGTGQSYQFAPMAPIDTPFPDRYGSAQSTPGGAWFNQPHQRAACGQPNPWYKTALTARPPANGSSNSSLVSLQQCQMSWGSLPHAATPPSTEPELPTTAEGGGAMS